MGRPGAGGALALGAGALELEAVEARPLGADDFAPGALAPLTPEAPGDAFATEGPALREAAGTAEPLPDEPLPALPAAFDGAPAGAFVAPVLPSGFAGAGGAFFDAGGLGADFVGGGGLGAAFLGAAGPFAGADAGFFAPWAGAFAGLRPAAGLAAPFADFPRAADRWVATCPVFSTSERAGAPARWA